MPITVLLADDHRVLREGLQCLLETGDEISVVGTASDGLEAVELAERLQPNVVVMDILMPRLNGIDATRSILVHHPAMGVLILSVQSSSDVIGAAIAAGARGYLPKESSAAELTAAIRAVASGERFFSDGISPLTQDSHRDAASIPSPMWGLTPAEREILKLVADGHTNIQAARLMGLSPRTVETYRCRLMAKLQLRTLPALVRFAIRNGISSLHDKPM